MRIDGFKVANDLDLDRFQTDLVLDKEYVFNGEPVVLRRIIAKPTFRVKKGLLTDKIETYVDMTVVIERPDKGKGILRGSVSAIQLNEFFKGLSTVQRFDNVIENYNP